MERNGKEADEADKEDRSRKRKGKALANRGKVQKRSLEPCDTSDAPNKNRLVDSEKAPEEEKTYDLGRVILDDVRKVDDDAMPKGSTSMEAHNSNIGTNVVAGIYCENLTS